MFAKFCKNGVTCFVISCTLLVRFGHNTALLLGAHDDLVDALVQLQIADHALARPCGKDGGFVEKIGKVRPGESARHAGDDLKIDIGSERLIAGMDLEDGLSALYVGKIDIDLSVKTAGAQQSAVKDIGTVGRRHDDNALVRLKTVHLNKDLVEGLLSLVVPSAESRSPLATHGVDLIDEDDAGLIAFCHIKEVAYTRCADADVHFHEVRAAHREEGHARLPRDRLCKQRFTRSGRAYKQHTLGDLCPEVGELLGALEEIDNFLEFLFLLLRPCNVGKAYFDVRGHPCLGFSEVHHLPAAAAHGTQNQEEGDDTHNKHGDIEDIPPSATGVWVLKGYLDTIVFDPRPDLWCRSIVQAGAYCGIRISVTVDIGISVQVITADHDLINLLRVVDRSFRTLFTARILNKSKELIVCAHFCRIDL